jgi:hypothetical protein
MSQGIHEVLTGAQAGSVLSLEKLVWDADAVIMCGRQHRQQRYRKRLTRPTWSETTCMPGNLLNGKRESPPSAHLSQVSPHWETANGVSQ